MFTVLSLVRHASVHVKILTFVPLKCNEVNVLNLSCPAVSLNCGKNTTNKIIKVCSERTHKIMVTTISC